MSTKRTVGAVLVWLCAVPLALAGVYCLGYFLASSSARGGLAPLDSIGLPIQFTAIVLWLVFWGSALGIVVSFFRDNRRIVLTMYVLTGVLIAAAIIGPIIVILTSP